MTVAGSSVHLRWDPYLMRRGTEFGSYWQEYLHSSVRKLLYVLGRGFDPRMCMGVRAVLDVGGKGSRDCVLIEFDEGPASPSRKHGRLVVENTKRLADLVKGRGTIIPKPVPMWASDGPRRRRIGSRQAADVFSSIVEFEHYTDVIIDISAMPRGIYFPLIGKVLHILDHFKEVDPKRPRPNLYIVVNEDARLDQRIRDVGVDDAATYIYGFGSLDKEATAAIPKVWIPILGEGQRDQLERINTLIDPAEICPVLPSPSSNPRRGDQLLREYRELLFDQWRVEPKNIAYASEQNPFETYRQIYQVARHYDQALKPLGGCGAAISALSSKLLSIGALLAAYELRHNKMDTGIAHVDAQGYEGDNLESHDKLSLENELFVLALAGDCYEE